MVFFWYLTRLFWTKWLGLCFASALIVMVFECLALSSGDYGYIFVKFPFVLHKMFPFVTFVTMIIFSWKLMDLNEWSALAGVGRSPWQILRTPLIWVLFLGIVDLFVVVPLGQKFFNPFESRNGAKKTEIALHSSGWQKARTTEGYVFFRIKGTPKHLLEFDRASVLIRHIIAETMILEGKTLLCTKNWDLPAHHTPVQKNTHRVELLQPMILEQNNTHPLLLSLAEVHGALEENPTLLLSARMHYWWSHFFWSVALAFLAPALILGPYNRHWKMFFTGCGIVGCLVLYLIKEWLYAISIPLSHTWPPILLWMPFFFTAGLAWVLFFEKKEL